MSNHPSGPLSGLPTAIAALSSAIGRAIRDLVTGVGRIVSAIFEALWDMVAEISKWIWSAYRNVESRIAAVICDLLLTIYAFRFLAVIIGFGVALAAFELWIGLGIYVAFILAAILLYFRRDGADSTANSESLQRYRTILMPVAEWSLRIAVSILAFIFMNSSLVSPGIERLRQVARRAATREVFSESTGTPSARSFAASAPTNVSILANSRTRSANEGVPAFSGALAHLSSQHRAVVSDYVRRTPGFGRPAIMSDCPDCKDGRMPQDWYSDSKHPFYAAGDFNHDGHSDFAIVSKRGELKIFNGPLSVGMNPSFSGSVGTHYIFLNGKDNLLFYGPPWSDAAGLVCPMEMGYEFAMPCKTPSNAANGPYRIGGSVSAPKVRSKVEPDYTEEARKAKLQGTVLLYIEVGEDGKPKNLRVMRSLGLGLDEKAMDAASRWRFQPGHKNGKPVTVAATIEVNFRLL